MPKESDSGSKSDTGADIYKSFTHPRPDPKTPPPSKRPKPPPPKPPPPKPSSSDPSKPKKR